MNPNPAAVLTKCLSALWSSVQDYLAALPDPAPLEIEQQLKRARRALVTGEDQRVALENLMQAVAAYTLDDREEDEIARARFVVLSRDLARARHFLHEAGAES